jgi:CheY-like chemotaxis protein
MPQTSSLSSLQLQWASPTHQPKYSVLLIEDSRASEVFIRHLCKVTSKDISLRCVGTGELALCLLEANPQYNLIIADHFLAGTLTGLDVWKVCSEKFEHIPFLMSSALSKEEFSKLVGDDIGGPLYLPKRLNLDTFGKILKEFLEDALVIDRVRRRRSVRSLNFVHTFSDLLPSYLFNLVSVVGVFIMLLVIPYHTPIHEMQTSGALQDIEFRNTSTNPARPQEELKTRSSPFQQHENFRDFVEPRSQKDENPEEVSDDSKS